MIVYLEAQLSIIQTRASESECFDSPAPLQLSNKKDGNDNSAKGRNDRAHVGGKEVCSLCDECHSNPKKIFTACRKFLTK